MYAGTKATTVGAISGLYKTVDGGTTWNLTSLQQGIGLVVIDPVTPSTLFATLPAGGLRKSIDSGVTWVNADILGTIFGSVLTISKFIIEPTTHNFFVITQGIGGGMFKSTNAGATWFNIFNTATSFPKTLAIDPQNPANILVGTFGTTNNVFRSTNGGVTWVQSSTGLPVGTGFLNEIVYDPFNPLIVYGDSSFKSVDGGVTWARFTAWLNSNSLTRINKIKFDLTVSGLIYALSSTFNYVVIDPFTAVVSARASSSGTISVYKSVDGGTTWIPSADGTQAGGMIGAVNSNEFILQGGNMYVVSSQGVFRESTTFSELQVAIKNNPGPINTGAPVSYIIKAMNNGPDNATGVVVTDTLPANTVLTAATSTKGACTSSAGVVTCSVGNLAAGSSATINLSLTASTAGNISNTVAITAVQPDPFAMDNSANTSTQITSPPPPPPPPTPAPSGGGGGGCAINTQSGFDPILPVLALIAGVWLIVRRMKMNY